MKSAPRKVGNSAFVFASFIIALALQQFQSVAAQGFQIYNPSDRTLPWATEINPAIISFQNRQISVGMKVFHLGFLEGKSFGMRENHINASFPWLLPYEIGVGADLKYFTAGIYGEFSGALLLSREVYQEIALGVKIGFEHRGFNRGEFKLVDQDDPLITSGGSVTNLNLGFGAYWNPGPLVLGFGVDHGNRPDVGVLGTTPFPREITGSIGYRLGEITPTLILHDDGFRWRFGIDLTAARSNLGAVRLGYEMQMPFKIEASLNLNRNSGLRYGIDLPTEGTRGASAGTQEMTYTHILAREPQLGQPEILFSTRELKVLQERIVRSLAADLRVEDLQAMEEIAPEYLQPVAHREDLLIVVAGPLSEIETDEGRIARQEELSSKIAAQLRTEPRLQAVLLADEITADDAREIQARIARGPGSGRRVKIAEFSITGTPDFRGFRPGRRTVLRKRPKLSEKQAELGILVSGKTRKTRAWRMIIRDAEGMKVRTFQGKGKLPKTIVWDWRNDLGELVPPGKYTAELQAVSTAGLVRKAVSLPVQVLYIRRTTNLQFHREPQKQTQKTEITPGSVGEL